MQYATPAQLSSILAVVTLALIAGFGPIAVAWALSSFGKPSGGSEAPQSSLSIGMQVIAGVAFCPIPVAWAAYLAMRPPYY
jgi:hypothetical protein